MASVRMGMPCNMPCVRKCIPFKVPPGSSPLARPLVHRRDVTARSAATGLKPRPWTGSQSEVQALAALQQSLQQKGYSVPEEQAQWYLRDRYFDPIEAEAKLLRTLNWRQTFIPNGTSRELVAAELATGKGYVHDHNDVQNRPVLVIRGSKHVIGQFPLDDSKRLCAYLLDDATSRLPPGQEQIIGIFDLKGFGVQNADVMFAKFMIEAFFEYYPRRCGEVLFVDAPWVFQPLYTTIKPLLRKYAALVSFVSKEQLQQQYFTKETIPADFK